MNQSIGKFSLEKQKLTIQSLLSKELFENISIEKEDLLGHVVICMFKEIMAYKCGSRIIRHPSNWKEAVKERWFPIWAKKRWPIRYTEYDALVIFPDFFKEHPVPKILRNMNYYFTYMQHDENPFGKDDNT